MRTNKSNSRMSFEKGHSKNNKIKNQKKTIFKYLQHNVVTASMVSVATGITQKNICRFKRDLELSGRLWEVEKKSCKQTSFKAWFLTTNPKEFERLTYSKQYKLL
jgi:hypothetical protein